MSTVIDIDANDWEREILQSESLVVVEFWHEQCPWCRMLEPIYRQVAEGYKGRVKFARLNALASHENQHLVFHYGVMSTPTMIFYCAGRPVGAAVGFYPKDRLSQLVEEVLKSHRECVEKSTQLKIA